MDIAHWRGREGGVTGEYVVVMHGLRMRQIELSHFWIFAYLLLLIEEGARKQ
jgi:hypothetical protein